LIEEAGVPVLEVIIRLVLAYALHETGACGEAQTHLDVAKKNASAMRSDYFSYLACLIDAYFMFVKQDCSSGLEALRTAMALGRQHNFTTMLYFWQPAVFSRLCASAIEAGIEVEYAKHLVRKLCLVPEKPPVHIENWPWPVKIYTMGRFAILINDAPLLPQRKAKQTPLRLLKAIIALGGRDISCDKLVDLLWPDADGDTAHHALETTLLRLRKLFCYPEAIILTDGKLTLDNRYCWVDAWAFERLLGQADALKADESLKKKELIEKAVALYKGDFFNGERQDSWMISSAEHLKSQYFKSVWWLVNYLQQQGQWDEAAEYCEKFLKVDACREDIYRNLMICQKNLGRKSEAMLVYQRCRKTLSCVLGIEPSRETRAIYNAILSEKK
jgi:DNA-binding SARP family transcriptional activator